MLFMNVEKQEIRRAICWCKYKSSIYSKVSGRTFHTRWDPWVAQWGFHWKYIVVVMRYMLVFSLSTAAGELINVVNSGLFTWRFHSSAVLIYFPIMT